MSTVIVPSSSRQSCYFIECDTVATFECSLGKFSLLPPLFVFSIVNLCVLINVYETLTEFIIRFEDVLHRVCVTVCFFVQDEDLETDLNKLLSRPDPDRPTYLLPYYSFLCPELSHDFQVHVC